MLYYNITKEAIMRPHIHPEYRKVLFHDLASNTYFLIGSTLATDRTREWEDGNTYPYVTLDVSSASHPFYTGKQKQVGKEGQVARFGQRFGQFFSKGKEKQ